MKIKKKILRIWRMIGRNFRNFLLAQLMIIIYSLFVWSRHFPEMEGFPFIGGIGLVSFGLWIGYVMSRFRG